jgi:hypothetical protein
MKFQTLLDAVERLKDDPRITPSTPIELDYLVAIDGFSASEQEPLVSISIISHTLVFSTRNSDDAIAR